MYGSGGFVDQYLDTLPRLGVVFGGPVHPLQWCECVGLRALLVLWWWEGERIKKIGLRVPKRWAYFSQNKR